MWLEQSACLKFGCHSYAGRKVLCIDYPLFQTGNHGISTKWTLEDGMMDQNEMSGGSGIEPGQERHGYDVDTQT